MITMSRRKSSVLLPFNATATRTGNQSSYAENVTQMRSTKTPAKRRRTQIEILEPEMEDDVLEVCEGDVIKHSYTKHCLFSNSYCHSDMKGKMWTIYRVADLNNFDNKKSATFSRYGRILSRYLVESFTEGVTLKATFVLKPDIQEFDAEDPPVHIKVEDVQLSQPKTVYEGTASYSSDKGTANY